MDSSLLDRLGEKYGTDKANPEHGYTGFYPHYLEGYRDEPLSFLEVGVFRGASLGMWDEYFRHPDARLSCVDTKRRHLRNVPSGSRWSSFHGDQSDRVFMRGVCAKIAPLDVVIEDGQHVPSHQIACFEEIWPHLRPGGLYVIEDIHTSYQQGFIARHAPADTGPSSIMSYLAGLLDELVAAPTPADTDYAFVHFFSHCVLIGKRDEEREG